MKIKISEIAGQIGLFFSGKLQIYMCCAGLIYFSYSPPEAKDKTTILNIMWSVYIVCVMFKIWDTVVLVIKMQTFCVEYRTY